MAVSPPASQRSGANGRAPLTPNIVPCVPSWSIQNASSRCGPSTGTPARSATSATPPQWSMWPCVTSTFSSVAPVDASASNSRSTSPPGSTNAARLVAWQMTSEQFCWNGVTGMIASFTQGNV